MAGICVEDPNNNGVTSNSDKCYSLRPRTAVVKRGDEDDEEDAVIPVWRQRRSGGGSRGGSGKRKQKPAPLSKYRRKTANARERSRMREINEAFDSLRRAVPGGGEPEKLTKITTLRLAMKYIAALSRVLSGEEPEGCSGGGVPELQQFQTNPGLLPLTPPGSEKSTEEQDPPRCFDLADLRDHCLTPTDFNDFETTIDFEDFFIT